MGTGERPEAGENGGRRFRTGVAHMEQEGWEWSLYIPESYNEKESEKILQGLDVCRFSLDHRTTRTNFKPRSLCFSVRNQDSE